MGGVVLEPVAAEPGVWRRRGYLPGSSGTFAFIVGISDYPHLNGTDEKLALSKLYVSALTAYRFFRYLVEDYQFDQAPLAEVVLLLAPTDAEKPFISSGPYPATEQTAPIPHFNVMYAALRAWRARLRGMSVSEGAKSRTMFLFSGHGLEVEQDEQLLLPADSLEFNKDVSNAINALQLYHGMSCVPILEQFYFIDACRNDVLALHNLSDVTGIAPFSVERTPRYDRAAPVIHATATGSYAFQPTSPGVDGNALSFFGRGILDALQVSNTANPVFAPDCTTQPCAVRVFPLLTYLNASIAQRLRDAKRAANDWVTANGARDRVIAYVPGHVPQPPAATGQPTGIMSGIIEKFTQPTVFSLIQPPEPKLPPLVSELVLPTPLNVLASAPVPIAPSVFTFLSTLRAYEWSYDYSSQLAGGWSQGGEMPIGTALEVSESGHRVVAHFMFDSGESWRWLQGDASGLTYGFLLPGSRNENPLYSFEFALDSSTSPSSPTIVDVHVNLSERNIGNLGVAAQLWATFRDGSPAREHEIGPEESDVERAAAALYAKQESPLAATVGALVLRRAGRVDDDARKWLRNLATIYGETSDGAIFLLEQRATLEEKPVRSETELLFIRARELGTPCTSDATGVLLRMLRFAFGKLEGIYPDDYREAMQSTDFLSVYGPLAQEYGSFRPGGLFTSFVGRRSEMPRIRRRIY